MWRASMVLVIASAGCPGSPRSPAPKPPDVVVTAPVTPTPWWAKGDAACPSLDTITPGAAPGATTQTGHVQRTPTEISCEAGGVRHGPSTRLDPDGHPAESGTMIAGRRTGAWTTFHPDGTVASFGAYNALGVPTGVWSTWYPSGHPRDRGELLGSAKLGLWQAWDDRGDPRRDPDRFVEYDANSVPVMHGVYRDGTPLEVMPVCVVGIAYPGCRLIPLVEVGLRVDPAEPAQGKRSSATFELGGLVNVLPHHSVGLTYGWVIDGSFPAAQIEVRYRFWLYRWMGLEGGAGRLLGRDGGPDGTELRVALVGADIGALTVTFEHHALPTGDESQVLFGVTVGLPTLLGAAYASLQN